MNREDAEKISQKVVEILENKRIANKVTKLKISKDTGLSRTAITLIVNNQNSPTLRTLIMMASSIGVDLKEIISEAEKK
ncbi:MAG: helix-turn-helix transcriptional regulator [Rhodospirillales bacterium]|jgi:transcriptional regulator with XRE-family HTH domain|nr:helix-turn-helix transcriptional regulator [Rhodospirillales bacterium]